MILSLNAFVRENTQEEDNRCADALLLVILYTNIYMSSVENFRKSLYLWIFPPYELSVFKEIGIFVSHETAVHY